MKNYITKLFAGAALLSLILAGCSSLKEDGGSLKREIKFSASVGTFQVKATDTAFESGDQVGLFADYPVSASNVRLTWQNGALTPDSPIYWGESQALDEATDFLAYYPYIEGQSGRGIEIFSVQADQTTHEAYTASDLMIAETISAPEDGTVDLNFIHRMTKLVLHIENRVDNRAVASVTVGNVYGSVSGSLASGSSLWCTGDPMVIKAGKVTTATGASAWTLIMAPEQNTRPSIIITMEDGEEFVYEADNEIWFVPARCYNAYVTIDAASVTTDFTSNVTDWYNGGEFWFGQHTSTPYGGVWSMIGTIEGTNWDTDLEMKQIDNGVWRRSWVPYHEGEEFKFRMDGSWDVNFGADSDFYMQDGYSYALMSYGENFKIERSGYYSVYLDLNSMCAYVIYKDELPSEFTWDYTASREYYMDSNLWLPVDWYRNISWYYAPNWNQIDGPEVTFTESTYEFTLPEATSDRWQAQMWIVPGEDLILSSDKTYTMTFTMATTSTFEFLVKFYEYGNDTNSSFDFTFRSEANNVMPYQFSFMGLDAPECLLFDFGTAPAGTKVYIKDITIKDDSASYTLDNLEPIVNSPDETTVAFNQVVYAISNLGFIAFDGKYSIYVYTGGTPACTLGDVVSVYGTKTTYRNVPEVHKDGLQYSILASNAYMDEPYWQDVTGSMGETFAQISIPISVTGTLVYDGSTYIIQVEGATRSCALVRPADYLYIDNLVGHKVTMKGFYTGWDDNNHWMMPYNYEDFGQVVENNYTAAGDGSFDNPFNATGAFQFAKNHAGEISGPFYVYGVISSIKYEYSAQYGTATFNISDDGSTTAPQFQAYQAYYFNGNAWTENDTQIAVGNNVILYGYVTTYNGAPELSPKQGWLYSLNGWTGPEVVDYSGWALVGQINGTDWDTDFTLNVSEDNPAIQYIYLDYNEGEQFKFRRNGAWGENFGLGEGGTIFTAADQAEYSLVSYGGNIQLESAGRWLVAIDLENLIFAASKVSDGGETGQIIEVRFNQEALAHLPDGGTARTEADGVLTITNSSSYSATVTELRIYKDQTLTLSVPNGYAITGVEMTCHSSYPASGFEGGAPDGFADGSWSGSAQELSFTAATKQVRITEMTVVIAVL
ncbi:MAG: fimbrillin family protein [Bacteroidales bacterium]|nr:fimbrillin family protein [Bacteroidales bacterium]